jgi:Fe-S-cluster-containing hydrogenase component 2
MSAPDPKATKQPVAGDGARRRRRRGRRRFLAWMGAGAAGLVVLARRVRFGGDRAVEIRVAVTENCVGCTACAVVCPTDAIQISPGGIHVVQPDCVSCGYCQAGCTVDGIRVVGEAPYV